ncbi:chymotrypsin-like protease CTRL-1 isoform X2 [Megalobrama amblycephala]|uniref:chymotrypsin-like protease CTRL-1 isoform X2 n=1 Tax=Megalobrama amblycephala TaxID=75352 RepID=UPI0020143CD5|nr:chymotrypsin-like protease CTRL-1 isoform X2 [Megalobrama amblycephala]
MKFNTALRVAGFILIYTAGSLSQLDALLGEFRGVSSPGPPARNTRESSRRHPEQMPEPPQLTPLNVEEQRLYSELLPSDRAPHPISKGAPSHPAEEAHFDRLYPGSCSFSHDPKLIVCGRAPLSNRIVGGEDATAGSWPWQVSIHVYGTRHNCGGTLINKDWVLSAAHCFQDIDVSKVVMYFGRLNQSGSNPNETSRTASRIITHPNYDSSAINNDIALVQLNSSVTFSKYIKPVCLAAAGSVFDAGTESWVTGWGKLHSGDTQLPNTLQQGDSGGPMLSRNGSLWIQSGISSFTTQRCEDRRFPSVFARVSQYHDWIKSYMGKNKPGFVKFIQTSNSNFGSISNPLLLTLPLIFTVISFTFLLSFVIFKRLVKRDH